MTGSDPKNTRDANQGSNREDFDADEDPLVELARIVSEDAGFASRLTKKPAAASAPPAPREAAEPPQPEDLSSDLEAELMQELETSFARREPVAQPVRPEPEDVPDRARYVEEEPEPSEEKPVVDEPRLAQHAEPTPDRGASREPPEVGYRDAPQAEAYLPDEQAEPFEPAESHAADEPAESYAGEPMEDAPPVDDPQDLLRSIEQQLSQFERVRSDAYVEDDDKRPVHFEEADEARDDWQGEPESVQPQSEYRFRGPAGAVSREIEVPTSVVEPPHAAETADEGEPIASEHVQHEPLVDEDDETPEAWATVSSADESARPRSVADLASLEEELSRELDPAYAGTPGSTWQPGERAADEQPSVSPAAAAAAVIAPEPRMQPPPRPATPPQQRGWSSGGLAMAAAILIVVALGGAAAMYLRSGDQAPSGPPPVIAAQEGPVKIEPAPSASDDDEAETVGEAVYDRVAGRAVATGETVVDGAEEPQEIERIVPPLRAGNDEESTTVASNEEPADLEEDSGAPAEQAAPADEEFGPRRVNTFVVRPDGTIVTTTEAQSSDTTSGQSLATGQSEEIEPRPVETVAIDEPRTAGAPARLSQGEAAEGSVVTESEETMSPPEAAEDPMTEPAEEATELAALQSEEEPEPDAAPAEEVETALADPEPEPVASPTATSGYLVQISSQTSEEAAEATFADLQGRFTSVLGGLEANIQRADLGDRGIYYRVRVGPWEERSQAAEVCEALQSAGGDCYVTQ